MDFPLGLMDLNQEAPNLILGLKNKLLFFKFYHEKKKKSVVYSLKSFVRELA